MNSWTYNKFVPIRFNVVMLLDKLKAMSHLFVAFESPVVRFYVHFEIQRNHFIIWYAHTYEKLLVRNVGSNSKLSSWQSYVFLLSYGCSELFLLIERIKSLNRPCKSNWLRVPRRISDVTTKSIGCWPMYFVSISDFCCCDVVYELIQKYLRLKVCCDFRLFRFMSRCTYTFYVLNYAYGLYNVKLFGSNLINLCCHTLQLRCRFQTLLIIKSGLKHDINPIFITYTKEIGNVCFYSYNLISLTN